MNIEKDHFLFRFGIKGKIDLTVDVKVNYMDFDVKIKWSVNRAIHMLLSDCGLLLINKLLVTRVSVHSANGSLSLLSHHNVTRVSVDTANVSLSFLYHHNVTKEEDLQHKVLRINHFL